MPTTVPPRADAVLEDDVALLGIERIAPVAEGRQERRRRERHSACVPGGLHQGFIKLTRTD
jgi:hypothetical protein